MRVLPLSDTNTKPKPKMITTYQHPNAGAIYRVYGVTFDSADIGERTKISLYRIGDDLHEISGDNPQGIATVQDTDHPVLGWGLTGPLAKVTSPNGWEIIVEKADLAKIK